MTTPKVGPFWRYYGGKWRAATRYPPPHFDTVIEPFAGAAGYSCRHYRRRVLLYDIDPVIVGTWEYLLRTPAAEILALPDVPEGGTVDDVPVCQEARWLIGWWLNSGSAQPCKSPSAWARERGAGEDAPHNWTGWGDIPRRRIARDVDRIRHWRIERRAWWDVPAREAAWYVDPPYSTPAGRHYKHSDIDYAALAEWCRRLTGQVIVCEQEGADWLPFVPFGHVKPTPGAHRTGRNAEVVWYGGVASQVPLLDAEAPGAAATPGRAREAQTTCAPDPCARGGAA